MSAIVCIFILLNFILDETVSLFNLKLFRWSDKTSFDPTTESSFVSKQLWTKKLHKKTFVDEKKLERKNNFLTWKF